MKRNVMAALGAVALLLSGRAAAQEPGRCAAAQTGALVIYGNSVAPLPFPLAELQRLGAEELKAPGHDGEPVNYRGVHLWRLLDRAGVTGKGELRGAELEQYLVAEAADGYRAVLALPEADFTVAAARTGAR